MDALHCAEEKLDCLLLVFVYGVLGRVLDLVDLVRVLATGLVVDEVAGLVDRAIDLDRKSVV